MRLLKICLIAFLATYLAAPIHASHAQGLRWYFKRQVTRDTVPAQNPATTVTTMSPGVRLTTSFRRLADPRFSLRTLVKTKTTVWAGPSVGFDAFVRESGTGAYKTGIIPGVGYGIKWGRAQADATKEPSPWIALDLFLQGAVSEEDDSHSGADFFNIDALPVLTFFNWVSVGYGPRFKSGLNGEPSIHRTLFSFGIRKAT